MTKIIVDTNIEFSALLNTNSRIGQILINGLTRKGYKNLIKTDDLYQMFLTR